MTLSGIGDRVADVERGRLTVYEEIVTRQTRLGSHDSVRAAASLWWLVLVHGLIALAAGILLLAWPDRTLAAVAIIVGIYLVLLGIVQVVGALARPGLLAMERAIPATVGLLAVAAGTIAITRPSQSVLAVALAAGILLIVAGLAAVVSAVRNPATRSADGVRALIDLGAGILLVAWPDVSVTVVAVVLGIYLIARGLLELVAAVTLARLRA